MACSSCGKNRRTSTRVHGGTSTATRPPHRATHSHAGNGQPAPIAPVRTFKVTLPDGSVTGGLTEHEALMLVVQKGGGIEPENTN